MIDRLIAKLLLLLAGHLVKSHMAHNRAQPTPAAITVPATTTTTATSAALITSTPHASSSPASLEPIVGSCIKS
ncbi:hypothetical protein BGZ79_002513 [Entomortierella chlamydospora]|nr:hypothetical protein BGZ79_002513 [Entomortierella chlamydospora]